MLGLKVAASGLNEADLCGTVGCAGTIFAVAKVNGQ